MVSSPLEPTLLQANFRCRIAVLRGLAYGEGEWFRLGRTERVLVSALATCRHGLPREAIEAMAWPDADPAQARNVFSVTLCRLRKRLGANAIVQDEAGYQFGDEVGVDVWELESLARRLETDPVFDIDEAVRWLSIYEEVACVCNRIELDSEWLVALERRFTSTARYIAERFAAGALEHGRPHLALSIARVSLEHDACDEAAAEIAIRCTLAMGDRAEAVRHYRDYARALGEELELSPSRELTRLLEAT
jgi:two-component SAPR family response regulator